MTTKNKRIQKKEQLHKKYIWVNALLLVLTFGFLLLARLYVNQPITGDEPHYLLMDYSLIHDHDFNLANNYANPHDTAGIYPGLSPFEQVGPKQQGKHATKQYSIHTIGLPLIAAPAFLIAQKWGVVVEMVLIATIVVWLTWIWTKRLTQSSKLAYAAAASLTCCFSFTALAGYIYPDVIIAGLALGCLIILDGYYDRPLYQLGFGVLAGFLVLAHFKGLTFAAPLLLILCYKNWRYKRQFPWLAFVTALPLMAIFFIKQYQWFGVLNPTQTYTKGYNFVSPPVPIISALLFDSLRGVLVYNPILLLIFIGIPAWFKQHRESLIITLLVTVGYIAVLASFNGWQGGDSSAGRYVIDFLPLYIPGIAFALRVCKHKWQKIAALILLLATIFMNLDYILTKWPYVRVEKISPLFQQIQQHTGVALNHLLPTFSSTTSITGVSVLMYKHGVIKIIADYIIVVALFVYGIYLSRSLKPEAVHKKAALSQKAP